MVFYHEIRWNLGASTAAYHTRTPAGAPCREGKRGVPRLHTICGVRYHMHQVSTPHVQGSQRDMSTSMASAKIGCCVSSVCCAHSCYPPSSSNNVFASWRPAVSKPSVNQP